MTIIHVAGATTQCGTALVCENQTYKVTTAAVTAWVWSVDGLQSGQGTDTAIYKWETTCDHTLTVVVTIGGVDSTETLDVNVTLSLGQICTAIKDTLEGAMCSDLLARAYDFNEIPEGVNDAPSLMVYWQNTVNDALRGETDRWTFANRRVKDMVFHVDYYANPRNNLARLNSNGSLDLTFDPASSGANG